MESFSLESMVRGYHVYKDIWISSVGEELPCQREPANLHDRHVSEPSLVNNNNTRVRGVTLKPHVTVAKFSSSQIFVDSNFRCPQLPTKITKFCAQQIFPAIRSPDVHFAGNYPDNRVSIPSLHFRHQIIMQSY